MAPHPATPILRAVSTALAVLAFSAPGYAQDTRAEAIAQEKARKAADLKPYQPSLAEKLVTKYSRGLFALPQGVYPAFGSVYAGGGLAVGPGARVFLGDRSYLEGSALYSIRQYKRVEAATVIPDLANGQVALRADAGWLDATQVGFFGVGMATSGDDRANFRLKQGFAGVSAEVRPGAGPLFATGGFGYDAYTLERGKGVHPSIEDRFTPVTAPELGAEPTYVRLSASAGADWRPSAGYARRGGLYGLGYHVWRDRDQTYSFERIDAEVVQHLPLLRENWVISLHGRMQSTVGDSDRVPYFLLPLLGSGSTLRAYSTGRFRDRHALLLQAEWRWIVNRTGMDMALFYDMGKVSDRRSGLSLSGMKSNVGIGLRLHGPRSTPLRIELARGNEGLNLVFAAGAAF
jgi:hypothetical protein